MVNTTRTQSQCADQTARTSQTPQSSQDSEQNVVELNWVFYDKSPARCIPCVVYIPRDLYEQKSFHLRSLFAQEIRDEYGVAISMPNYILFWTPKEPLSINAALEIGWAANIHDFSTYFIPISTSQDFGSRITSEAVANERIVHVVVTYRNEGLAVGESDVDELKEYERYQKLLRNPVIVPSDGAKSTVYRNIQNDDSQVIHDGRHAPRGISTVAPPIEVFHPIFNDFIRFVNDPDVQPTPEDLDNVRTLMSLASGIYLHDEYLNKIKAQQRKALMNILVNAEADDDATEVDNILNTRINTAQFVTLVLEWRRELGEGGCDSSTQAGLSMKRTWLDPNRKPVREKCCCPTFLVAGGGPWLCVMGSVITDKVIVQRLTDMKWMALSSTEETDRAVDLAKVLVALRKCIEKLREFYSDEKNLPPFVPDEPHPRYFPYPKSFPGPEGTSKKFKYVKSLEDDPACVTYLAEIPDEFDMKGEPVKVVVKFVVRYGKEVHEFLATEGHAPALRYYGPLPGQNRMHMVVMEYIHHHPKPLQDIREQVKSILNLLHSKGYVFGDFRKPNILVDAHNNVKFIDFDWCGLYDMTIRVGDAELPHDVQNQIRDGPYTHYPWAMSRIDGMWFPEIGMCPLAPIRPEHDWAMFDKLFS